MRARWVCNNPSPELPIVGQAIIASYIPGKYHIVSTIELDSSSPLSELTRSMGLNISYNDVPTEQDEFVTQVFKCDKNGWVKSFDHPLFEKTYTDLDQARTGHNETVELLSQGKLRLSSRSLKNSQYLRAL